MSGVPEGPKLPPQNLEAEQALLGAILVSNEALDRVFGIFRRIISSIRSTGGSFDACRT